MWPKEKERHKQIQEKCQLLLNKMLRNEDNKYCVDCDAKGPRWASWNLGVFLCIRCAGIHRNLGVHISKVKSINLDSWTPEQVVSLQQMGNSCARAVYEANLPDGFRRPQTDCSLESFIRAKYEHKKYIAREWVPPPLPKVNWDKELDEEAERRRRKKDSHKSSPISYGLTPIKKPEIVPQLPKPRSSASPKPITTNSATSDLLGLDCSASLSTNSSSSEDDMFTSFLSAPPASSASLGKGINSTNHWFEQPEEPTSSFNMRPPTLQEQSKMTTDSILALYHAKANQQYRGNMYNQHMPNQHFQQQMPNQPMYHQPQRDVPFAVQMDLLRRQLQRHPPDPNEPPPFLKNILTMQARRQVPTSSGSQTGHGNNNGRSGMAAKQKLQPAPGNNPFLNLGPKREISEPLALLPQQMAEVSLSSKVLAEKSRKQAASRMLGQTFATDLWQ